MNSFFRKIRKLLTSAPELPPDDIVEEIDDIIPLIEAEFTADMFCFEDDFRELARTGVDFDKLMRAIKSAYFIGFGSGIGYAADIFTEGRDDF